MTPAPPLARLPANPDQRALLATVAANYGLYHEVAARLAELQAWVRDAVGRDDPRR